MRHVGRIRFRPDAGGDMRRATVVPTGIERRVGTEEIIVSKTDTRGVIKYVNDVFLRISGYRRGELVGRPHNIIRHPDMPSCVFKVLWDSLLVEREVFAYVVNLAADGSHYWVLAHVTPSFDASGQVTGYHSNRRAADPHAVARIGEFYGRLRAVERAHAVPSDGLAASSAMLAEVLEDRGQSYDEYVWELTNHAEVRS